jgi:hypothetical protein
MPIVRHFADLAYCRADCPGCSRNDHNLAWSRHSKIKQPKKSRQPIQAEDSERERQWQIAFLHFASDKCSVGKRISLPFRCSIRNIRRAKLTSNEGARRANDG